MTDLRCGDWRDVLADVECDALICDPPYGARTHQGHAAGVKGHNGTNRDGVARQDLCYSSWSRDDVAEFCSSWAPRVRGWFCVMTSHDLLPAYFEALEGLGRYVFAPVHCVIRGMTVRLSGDGPSSWGIYLVVSRPKNLEFSNWGTLPGAYVTARGAQHIGGKPEKLMNAIVRDYSRPGDLVCDPCAGLATTALACTSLGRRFVGSEIDPETHAKAIKRLSKGVTMDMFGGAA